MVEIFVLLPGMGWFNKPRESPEPVEPEPKALLELELESVEHEYHLAEKEFGDAALAVVKHRPADAVRVTSTGRAMVHLNQMQRNPEFAVWRVRASICRRAQSHFCGPRKRGRIAALRATGAPGK